MKDNRSVKRMLSILELIAKNEEGLTLGQIYRRLDLPKATVYDFLQTLYKADAIYYKDPNLKNYVIGSKMFAIGSVYTKHSNLIEASQTHLQAFAKTYNQTVFITKRVDDKLIYIYKYQSPLSKINTAEAVGTVVHDYKDHPVGSCFDAYNQQHENNNESQLNAINKDDYTYKNYNHMALLAVPIWNFEMRICGVIVAVDLAVQTINRQKQGNDFVRVAKEISLKLGYKGNTLR